MIKEEMMQKKSVLKTINESIFLGISYIVPLIIAGSMIMTLAIIFFGRNEVSIDGTIGNTIKIFGNNILALMVPIFSGYVAYGIAEKEGLIPGIAGGIAANMISSGFLGGIVSGLIAGYVVLSLKKFKVNNGFQGLMNAFVYPLLGSIIVGCLMLFLIGKPIAILNSSLANYLGSLEGANKIILGVVIGFMVCFDMGGPVNKAAFGFTIAAIEAGNGLPYAAFAAAKCMPGIAISISTILFSKYYEPEEVETGKSSWLLGLAGVTEAAMPFAISDPLRVIPSMMIGGGLAAAISIHGESSLLTAGGSILTVAITQKPINWLMALLIGTIASAAVLTLLKKIKYDSKRVAVSSTL